MTRTRLHHRQRGLTLLEVLAAFMIFSLVFTVLVGSSQSGVHSQGTSARKLAANEVADRVLADIEVAMAKHELPLIEENEYPLEEFTIRIEERGLFDEDPGGNDDAFAFADALAGGPSVAGLLDAELPNVAKHLRRYDIEVEWIEGAEAQILRRTTFAFDWPAAEIETGGLLSEVAGESGRDDTDDSERSEDGDETGRDDDSGSDRGRSKSGGSSKKSEAEEILEKMRPFL
jgi:type II secretory pathway pseudopilin PulG